MHAVQARSSVKDVVVESEFFWSSEDSGSLFGLDRIPQTEVLTSGPASSNLTPIQRTVDMLADVDGLRFLGYQFPSGLGALEHHFETARLRTLQLESCVNIGYLFNSLLCNIQHVRLKTLIIDHTNLASDAGYFGSEKIKCFLIAHRGLEEIAFSHLGENRPCLRAILSQGLTLRSLKLCESRIQDKGLVEQREPSSDVEDIDCIRKACLSLRHLTIDQVCII